MMWPLLVPGAIAVGARETREAIVSTDFNESARRPRNAVEPGAAGVYLAPEARSGSGPHFGSGLIIDTAAELFSVQG
jgi:hypothetical protein